MPRGRESQYQRRYDEGIERDRRAAIDYGEMFASEVARDPREAYKESANAMFTDFRRNLGEQIEGLRANQVGAGRYNTGFRTQDEDELVTDLGRDLNTRLADRALDAERLGLQRTGMISGVAERAQDRATAAAGGEYHTERAQRLEDKRSRRSMWGKIAGGLITAAGTAAGGPIGGAIAGAIANRWGQRQAA